MTTIEAIHERSSYNHASFEDVQFAFVYQISITSLTKAGRSTLLEIFEKEHRDKFLHFFPAREVTREFALKHDCAIGEGPLAHIFMPYAFHVLLECSLAVRALRSQADLKKMVYGIRFEDVLREIEECDKKDAHYLKRKYPGADWKPAEYDAVVDTGILSPHEAVAKIIHCHRLWLLDIQRTGRKQIFR